MQHFSLLPGLPTRGGGIGGTEPGHFQLIPVRRHVRVPFVLAFHLHYFAVIDGRCIEWIGGAGGVVGAGADFC
jgi:hypothetical protein